MQPGPGLGKAHEFRQEIVECMSGSKRLLSAGVDAQGVQSRGNQADLLGNARMRYNFTGVQISGKHVHREKCTSPEQFHEYVFCEGLANYTC
eukprot:1137446-Pelagomonas_calceolata.AAC.19